MKRTLLIVASLSFASGLALAQDEESQSYDPNPDSSMQDSHAMSEDTMAKDTMGKGLSAMTAEDLKGMKVVSSTGEEIGEISDVGKSDGSSERVAAVDVGGFLGVGEKTIAIPLSELEKSVSDEDSARTMMTRETLESQPELDDSMFTSDEDED